MKGVTHEKIYVAKCKMRLGLHFNVGQWYFAYRDPEYKDFEVYLKGGENEGKFKRMSSELFWRHFTITNILKKEEIITPVCQAKARF